MFFVFKVADFESSGLSNEEENFIKDEKQHSVPGSEKRIKWSF